MGQKLLRVMLLGLVIFLWMPLQPIAAEITEERGEIIELLHNAFDAQVSLSEQDRSLEEVKAILSPYFTDRYMELFLAENLVETNGKYGTLGSDFAEYFIPFFEFSTKTKIATYNNQLYVYEYFPENGDGPVSYPSHYEGLLLDKVAGKWKVSEYLYDNIPQEVLSISQIPIKRKTVVVKANVLFPFSFQTRAPIKTAYMFTRFQTLIINPGRMLN